jgi:hypothetical protein
MMAGSQFGFDFKSNDDVIGLFDVVNTNINNCFDTYNFTHEDIEYVQLSLRKVDIKLISEFNLDKSNYNSVVDNNIISNITNIPVSVN